MKSFSVLMLSVLLFVNTKVFSQNVGINSTGATPRNCAMLDILSSNTGLLIPNLSLTSTTTYAPATGTAVDGLLIYNTNSAVTGTGAAGTGYYYWSTAAPGIWLNLVDNLGWQLLGNTGITNPAVPGTYGTSTFGATENWLGTTDAKDLTFGTNNIERMRIKQATGFVGIGTAAPGQALDIYGKFQVNASGDAVKIKNVTYSWPGAQGAASTYLKNDGSGNLSWAQLYGGNVQYTTSVTDITTNSATFANMTGMSITFTPVHSVVFLNFTASGATDLSGSAGYVECRAVNGGGTVLGGCVSLCDESQVDPTSTHNLTGIVNGSDGAWNCSMIIPITVTPGTSTTIKVQWMRDGTNPSTAICEPTTYPNFCHRTMVIWD